MHEGLFLLCVLALVLMAELVNGWTDAPNAIATVVSTRTLPVRTAIILATCLNIVGAFTGTAVAATIGEGIVKTEALDLLTLSAALVSIISWGVFAWRFGLPTSKSHALIAGLTGAGLAVGGPSALIWSGWLKVLLGLFFSVFLGAAGGWFVAKVIQFFFKDSSPGLCRKNFARLQILSASCMALSHGSNDGQKFIGVFSLALLLGGVSESFHVPFWVIVICAVVMGIGTSIGGLRIIKTMGYKMLKLETYQGFSAEMSAASTIIFASSLGVPLSTTHTIGTAIMGVGMARRAKSVRWQTVLRIIYAWLLTFPICGAVSFIAVQAFHTLSYWIIGGFIACLFFLVFLSDTVFYWLFEKIQTRKQLS